MLTGVHAYNADTNALLIMRLAGSESDAIQIKVIDGLDPVKASINTSPYGVVSGEAVTGTSVGKRNIVLTLGLNPDWKTQTNEELRTLLYRYFMPETNVRFRFYSTHLPDLEIVGVVESMTANMFARDPEIQVSIICGRPDFVAADKTTVSGVVGTPSNVNYEGTVQTGFNFVVKPSAFRGAYTGTLDLLFTSGIFRLPSITIDETRFVELNTVPGSKHIRVPGPPQVNLLGQVEAGYRWPILKPGSMLVQVLAEVDGQAWELSYYARFGGL